jgi:hypothetical protein
VQALWKELQDTSKERSHMQPYADIFIFKISKDFESFHHKELINVGGYNV